MLVEKVFQNDGLLLTSYLVMSSPCLFFYLKYDNFKKAGNKKINLIYNGRESEICLEQIHYYPLINKDGCLIPQKLSLLRNFPSLFVSFISD